MRNNICLLLGVSLLFTQVVWAEDDFGEDDETLQVSTSFNPESSDEMGTATCDEECKKACIALGTWRSGKCQPQCTCIR